MNEIFIQAAKDYFYLTERGYPQRGFLDLVGNRYALSNAERSMLYRGIVSLETATRRKSKYYAGTGSGLTFHVDCLNVITTVSSFLLGLPVFISFDGFLRDASLKRGKLEKNPKLGESMKLVAGFLSGHPSDKAIFYIDEAGEVTEKLVQYLTEPASRPANCEVKVVKNADRLLISAKNGVVCTSDSEIIDQSKLQVFDLARQTLRNAFHPSFLELKSLIETK